jgi:hypothetical protein
MLPDWPYFGFGIKMQKQAGSDGLVPVYKLETFQFFAFDSLLNSIVIGIHLWLYLVLSFMRITEIAFVLFNLSIALLNKKELGLNILQRRSNRNEY